MSFSHQIIFTRIIISQSIYFNLAFLGVSKKLSVISERYKYYKHGFSLTDVFIVGISNMAKAYLDTAELPITRPKM